MLRIRRGGAVALLPAYSAVAGERRRDPRVECVGGPSAVCDYFASLGTVKQYARSSLLFTHAGVV